MTRIDHTHDPAASSWVATPADGDFPIQNLPFGRFRRGGAAPRLGVAIGDRIVDLAEAAGLGIFDGPEGEALAADDMLPLLRLGRPASRRIRHVLFEQLRGGGGDALRGAADRVLVDAAAVEMLLPTRPRQFSDMCVSTFHIGRRRGSDERGEPICPPVFRTLPVGYDGRASSVVISGTPVTRPNGQWQERFNDGELRFGPEPRQDYELELGLWLGGSGNALGRPMCFAEARDAMFGITLLNDWSARGIQFWETMLGPFLGKSIATTVSPWIVTMDALAPYHAPAFVRPAGDPVVPRHLDDGDDQASGGYAIELSAHLRPRGGEEERICLTDFRHMYWTWAQMLVHHASNGCSLGAGDLIGSGTCSGPEQAAAACLVEANLAGPLRLAGGLERTWLEDGDTVTLRGRLAAPGRASIGFGYASGTVEAAVAWPEG